jgi:ankyrin repeat protein
MTDYTCVKRLSKCKMFDVNNLSKDTSMYDIHYRKCSIHKGELLEKNEDIKYCDEAQTVLNENDIKLLLDRDIIDSIRHDSVNRFVQLLTDSNRINDLSKPIDYNYEGNTLLHEAIYWNSNKCILYLLKNCTNFLDAKNKDGNTVMHIACIKGHSFLINELYKQGMDINLLNNKDENILHCAVKCGKLDIVKQVYSLINAPCSLSKTDNLGRKPLHTAVISNNRDLDIIKFLVNEGSDMINVDKSENSIMNNLNRLEKNSLNIQIKTFLKKSVYDVYHNQPQEPLEGEEPTEGVCKNKPLFYSYDQIIQNNPEYAPFIVDEGDTTVINEYKVTYPDKDTEEKIDNSDILPKKKLPIKLRSLFNYVEPFENNTNNKQKDTPLYKELLAICLLFIILFIFYYE